jgi:hypothetical protein
MSRPTIIAAFDLASATGVCIGPAGGKPTNIGTILLSMGGSTRPLKLAYLGDRLKDLFSKIKVDAVRYEAPLNIRAMLRTGATEEVISMLRGTIAILECEAARAGIVDISHFEVNAARQALTGYRTFPRRSIGRKGRTVSTGKDRVMEMVTMMGVKVGNNHESDAYCGWAYCSSLIRSGLVMTPLFQR